MNAEKNDVDINRLFSWGRVYQVVNSKGEVEADVYMRLLGDADANRARVYALRESAELRKKLLDLNGVERMIYIKDIEELEREDLVNYIVFFSMRDITNRAIREVKVPAPKIPKSNASLAKMEKYQKEVDEHQPKLRKAIDEFVKKEVDALKKSVESDTKEILYRKYSRGLTDEFCEQRALAAYRDMEIYLGCYKDDDYSERFFDSFEQFDNLDSKVKADFRSAYETLDMKTEELKKLREATL